MLICTPVQMWRPNCWHVTTAELHKGISLLHLINHNAQSIHSSAEYRGTNPEIAHKAIRKVTLKFVCIKFLTNQKTKTLLFFTV